MRLTLINGDSLGSISTALVDELQSLVGRIRRSWNVEHTESDGHADVTAHSLTITRDDQQGWTGNIDAGGAGLFRGDVVAQKGTGVECGIGTLSTVNGTTLANGEVQRSGVLIGGVASGFWWEKRIGQSPMDGSTSELCLWNLKFDTTHPIVRIGVIGGVPVVMDGGTGATAISLGDFTRPIGTIYTNTLTSPGGTLELSGGVQMPNANAVQMKSVGGTTLNVLRVDATGNGHVIGGHSADFPLGMVRAAAGSINAGSANMDGGLLWDTTNSWLVGYVNGVRYKFVGTPY